ncbi:MAG: hypothetical protein WBE26_16650 [Phycisphaerae bacterium]
MLTALAGIDRSHRHDSIPQPPVRLPKSDHKRLTTRLYFEAVTLKQLAASANHLETSDLIFRVSAVNLTNRDPATTSYGADLAVSYFVYTPH